MLIRTHAFWTTKYTVKLARAKLPANAGIFTCSSQAKRPDTQFTCVTCSLPVKTGKFTCVEAGSTSRRIHAIALNKARKLQVTSPAWCRLTYLQFADDLSYIFLKSNKILFYVVSSLDFFSINSGPFFCRGNKTPTVFCCFSSEIPSNLPAETRQYYLFNLSLGNWIFESFRKCSPTKSNAFFVLLIILYIFSKNQ